jgi:hypothetical protein
MQKTEHGLKKFMRKYLNSYEHVAVNEERIETRMSVNVALGAMIL